MTFILCNIPYLYYSCHTFIDISVQWEDCIVDGSTGSLEKLLSEGNLPPLFILDKSCLKFGHKSDIVKLMCGAISKHIKSLSDEILNVWPAYEYTNSRESDQNKIIFVLITKNKDQMQLNCEYRICIRDNRKCSLESAHVVKRELETCEIISYDKLTELTNIVNKHAKSFTKKHSNITMMSVSWMKSKGFGTPEESIEQLPCIALYVHIKGMIPIAEDPFPVNVENFPVDVREATFTFLHGGPCEYHEKLKMGCAIGSSMQNADGHFLTGTLGGFVDHPEHGVCCITCGHVLYSPMGGLRGFENGVRDFGDHEHVAVYQPISKGSPEFGIVKKVVYREGGNGTAGVDVALVKIFHRIPINGDFPFSIKYPDAGNVYIDIFTCILYHNFSYILKVLGQS